MRNEFFFWLASASASYNKPSHFRTREKAGLKILTRARVTELVHRL